MNELAGAGVRRWRANLFGGSVVALLLGALLTPAGAFPAARAFGHLLAQCEMGPRNPGSEGHRRCAAYIQSTLEACGGRLVLQRFRHESPALPEEVELTNILARFGPERPGGLLFGAHWDTRPWADRDPDSLRRRDPILGANDGASGTALLLALAETFRADPPAIPVLLVFFDGEDFGRPQQHEEWLAGSRHFVKHFTGPMPEAALIVDMVASESMLLVLEQQCRQLFPSLAALIDELAAEEALGTYSTVGGPGVLDDHVPLIEAGIPALLLLDFRDPYWHTLQDVPAHCSVETLGQAGRLVERLVRGGFFR